MAVRGERENGRRKREREREGERENSVRIAGTHSWDGTIVTYRVLVNLHLLVQGQ